MYQITYKGKVIKEYPHRIQAVIWLMMKGHIYYGEKLTRFGLSPYWLDPRFEIKEVEK